MMTCSISKAQVVTALLFCAWISACKSSPGDRAVSSGGGSGGSSGSSAVLDSGAPAAGAGGTGGAPIDEIETCAELGERVCARFEECAPFLLEAYYGSVDNCRALFSGNCDSLEAESAKLDRRTCAEALTSCGEFVAARGAPSTCWMPRGTVALGGACASDADCDEGSCQREKGAAQGSCAMPAAVGQPCSPPVRCAATLRCDPVELVCVKAAADGASCSSPFDCQFGSTCGPDGLCAPMSIGTKCVDSALPCNVGRGQLCLLDECREMSFATEANACIRSEVECPGLERCVIRPSGGLMREASCRQTAGLNAECGADTPCVEPLTCRGSKCRP